MCESVTKNDPYKTFCSEKLTYKVYLYFFYVDPVNDYIKPMFVGNGNMKFWKCNVFKSLPNHILICEI